MSVDADLTLAKMRGALERFHAHLAAAELIDAVDAAELVAAAAEALDMALTNGGELPEEWKRQLFYTTTRPLTAGEVIRFPMR